MRLGIVSDYDFYMNGKDLVYVNRGQRLLEYLCSRFDEVVYFGRLNPVKDVSTLLPIRCNGFHVVALRVAKKNPLLDAIAVAKRFLARQHTCDVFLVKLGNLHALVTFVLLKLLKRPVVCYAINDLDCRWYRYAGISTWRQWVDRVLHYVWRILYVLGDARLAISPTVARHHEFLGWGRDARLYVETSLSPGAVCIQPGERDVDELTILSVGRLVDYKGHSFLIKAAEKLVHGEGLPFRLVIVGDGPLRYQLQGLVVTLGLSSVVSLVGYVPQGPELWKYYSAASIYVQPSLTESFGMAVLEAMYFGLPVVASAVGGLKDLVRDGETGLLVHPADAASLKDALVTLLRSPTLRSRLGNAARIAASRYALENETDTLVKVIRDVASKRGVWRIRQVRLW